MRTPEGRINMFEAPAKTTYSCQVWDRNHNMGTGTGEWSTKEEAEACAERILQTVSGFDGGSYTNHVLKGVPMFPPLH